jgi:phosphopantothenoylcysteine decarboxylase/phosphopantothenate--cysteine ligase
MFRGKKILLGVTGSIAAYKSAVLVRALIKEGAEVRVVMTPSSKDFVTPLTLATLSKNPVEWEFVQDSDAGTWNNHVELGLWADFLLIAPASANTVAKMAQGICDNLLLATYLSAQCSVGFAPAMDRDMIEHAGVQGNIQKLIQMGHILFEPEAGELASGLEGKSRMAEPERIAAQLKEYFEVKSAWIGMEVLITAGPTYEAIDPVRFIGNRSSGKMGYAIAQACANRGALVTLVSGPVAIDPPEGLKEVVRVESAAEMKAAVELYSKNAKVIVMSAAVADYRPSEQADQKIKKASAELKIDLQQTDDILKFLGENKQEGQILIGFALETNNAEENAKSKLERKNLDAIVLNLPSEKGTGFGYDTNQITIYDRNNKSKSFGLKQKSEVAQDILNYVETLF